MEKNGKLLIAEVKTRVHEDPYRPVGQRYAKRWMNLVQKYWSDQELGEVIWDCYKQNKFGDQSFKESMQGWPGIPQDVVHWIDKAVGFIYSEKKKG